MRIIINKFNNYFKRINVLTRLIAVSNTRHSTHDTKHVVVSSVYSYLSSVGSTNSVGGKNKLKSSVINSGEVSMFQKVGVLQGEERRSRR